MTSETISSLGRSSTSATNPFPVYPVSSLREIAATILDKTVSTDAVISIERAIRQYADPERSSPRGLAMRIRGDYGTGKTHLLMFAQAFLRQNWPNGESRVTALLASATETTFSSWYQKVVGPLVAQLDLEGIFVRVLAQAALDVADQVLLTLDEAALIRADPFNVYPALRDGLISWTDVERAMAVRVNGFAQRGSDELQVVLSALPWPERRPAAIRWLSGKKLDPAELEQLGITRELDAEAEAEAVLVALAGAALLGGGSFAFIVDEFEHLMADDRRTGTIRNATAMKRLLEGLTAMGALVLVAGHWKAWEDLLPDVKARFTGQATVDLIALTGEEVGKLAAKAAPDWHPRLSDAALDAIVEAGGRNIRRVLGVLHQLYAETKTGSDPIEPVMVRAAAETLRGLAAATVKAADSVVEETVYASGGKVVRNETLFGRLRFDMVARRSTEIRLVADIRHAATTAELSQLLEDFSIAVNAVQRRYPEARGLLIVSGAVDQSVLGLLQPLPGIDALASEDPHAEEEIQALVQQALSVEALPTSSAMDKQVDESEAIQVEAMERIREVRRDQVEEAERTSMRLQEVDFGGGEREAAAARAARGAVPETPASALGPDRHVLDSFSENMAQQKPSVLSFMFSRGNVRLVGACFICCAVLLAISLGGNQFTFLFAEIFATKEAAFRLIVISSFCFTILLVFLIFELGRRMNFEFRAYVHFHRFGRQTLEELILREFPHKDLVRIKNGLIDLPDSTGGFRYAVNYAKRLVAETLSEAEMKTR